MMSNQSLAHDHDARISNTTTIRQWLIRFQDKTHVCDAPDTASVADYLLNEWSLRTGWPVTSLQIQSMSWPFASLVVRSSVIGGKGGFGTLLKGQSRQAGAKLTTDFGACRDLQGRRLRHVNDEIKLRKWREAQEAGGGQAKDAMFDTPSGLYNWHLMVPNWADISKKGTRKIQRQFQRLQREQDKVEQAKKDKQAQYEQSVANYVNQAAQASKEVKSGVLSAIQQGLQVQQERKRKRQEETEKPQQLADTDDQERPNSLCTLSGDVVVEEKTVKEMGAPSKSILQIQSQSDFATMALFLDKPVPGTKNKKHKVILYYEVRLVTGGLAQLGWADMTSNEFHPNCEQGEGVGDDAGSYAYDGSRSLKFHNGNEEVYGQKCKAGDVVGCLYNVTTGDISYSINGTDLGVAFTVKSKAGTILLPALSCNGGEILELHIGAEDMEHTPKNSKTTTIVPVKELVVVGIATGATDENVDSTAQGEDDEKKPEAKPSPDKVDDVEMQAASNGSEEKKPKAAPAPEKKDPIKVEPLDLEKFESVRQLEKLGLDRLKGALMAIGVKCGGSLTERASRLFSLKGLERKDFPAKVRAKNFIV